MTVSDILQLSAAGFSKAEILAMSNADTGKHEQKEDGGKPKEKKETVGSADFVKALEEINKRLDALTQTKAEPEKKEEPKKDNTDVLALLQSMNVAGQRYDLPPQYDPEQALAGALDAVMNGAKKGE